MKRNIFLIIGLTLLISSCSFVGNIKNYTSVSKELINCVLTEDYDAAYEYFAYEKYENVQPEALKEQLRIFRQSITDAFGTEFKLSFVYASKKTHSTSETGPFPTKVQLQLKTDTHYGYFTILFDDEINKVINIDLDQTKDEIPSMFIFWLFGVLPISVVGFNIYTIRKLSKTKLKRKWLKIVGIIFLNVPALTYSVVNGFLFELMHFQIFLGMSFSALGYANTYWTFGIPLGSFIVHYKMKTQQVETEEVDSDINQTGV